MNVSITVCMGRNVSSFGGYVTITVGVGRNVSGFGDVASQWVWEEMSQRL